MSKTAHTRVPVHGHIANRWSPRAFQTRPVEREKIIALMEAARWAPSSRNLRPWHFILANSDQPDDHARMAGCLSANNRRWAARAMDSGLMLRQMGGFDREKARVIYQIPATHEPVCVLAIGYRAEPDVLPDDLRDRESGPRTRKPLSEFVFSGTWGDASEVLGEPASV